MHTVWKNLLTFTRSPALPWCLLTTLVLYIAVDKSWATQLSLGLGCTSNKGTLEPQVASLPVSPAHMRDNTEIAKRRLSGGTGHKHDSMFFLFVTVILGTGVTHLNMHPNFRWLQQTVVLFVLGVLASVCQEGFLEKLGWKKDTSMWGHSYDMWMGIDPHLLLFALLPALLAGDAMNIDTAIARRVAKQCIYLASVGVIINAMATALFLWWYLPYNWSFLLSVTVGSILCATDPVAVVALLKELGAPPTLTVQIQGESLLNDGTAIVLYTLAYNALKGEQYDVTDVIMFLVKTAFGACGVGFVLGWVFYSWIAAAYNKLEEHSSMVQISLTLSSAYWSFILAEGVLEMSGVLATVVTSLVLADKMWPVIASKESMHTVWHVFEYLGNSLIFFLAGALTGKIMVRISWSDYLHLIVIYVVLTLIRFFMLILSRPMLQYFGKEFKQRVNLSDILVMTWGGLRGAVGLALAIQVTIDRAGDKIANDDADRVLFYVGGVAALTMVVNATTAPLLVHWLGVANLPETKQRILLMIHDNLFRMLDTMTLKNEGLHDRKIFELEKVMNVMEDRILAEAKDGDEMTGVESATSNIVKTFSRSNTVFSVSEKPVKPLERLVRSASALFEGGRSPRRSIESRASRTSVASCAMSAADSVASAQFRGSARSSIGDADAGKRQGSRLARLNSHTSLVGDLESPFAAAGSLAAFNNRRKLKRSSTQGQGRQSQQLQVPIASPMQAKRSLRRIQTMPWPSAQENQQNEENSEQNTLEVAIARIRASVSQASTERRSLKEVIDQNREPDDQFDTGASAAESEPESPESPQSPEPPNRRDKRIKTEPGSKHGGQQSNTDRERDKLPLAMDQIKSMDQRAAASEAPKRRYDRTVSMPVSGAWGDHQRAFGQGQDTIQLAIEQLKELVAQRKSEMAEERAVDMDMTKVDTGGSAIELPFDSSCSSKSSTEEPHAQKENEFDSGQIVIERVESVKSTTDELRGRKEEACTILGSVSGISATTDVSRNDRVTIAGANRSDVSRNDRMSAIRERRPSALHKWGLAPGTRGPRLKLVEAQDSDDSLDQQVNQRPSFAAGFNNVLRRVSLAPGVSTLLTGDRSEASSNHASRASSNQASRRPSQPAIIDVSDFKRVVSPPSDDGDNGKKNSHTDADEEEGSRSQEGARSTVITLVDRAAAKRSMTRTSFHSISARSTLSSVRDSVTSKIASLHQSININYVPHEKLFAETDELREQLNALPRECMTLLGDLPEFLGREKEEVMRKCFQGCDPDASMLWATNEAVLNLVFSQYWNLIDTGDVIPGTNEAEILLTSVKLALSNCRGNLADIKFIKLFVQSPSKMALAFEAQQLEQLCRQPDYTLGKISESSKEVERAQKPRLKLLVESTAFNTSIMGVIILNTFFWVFEVQLRKGENEKDIGWLIADVLFTSVFLFEFCARFAVLRCSYFRNKWNQYDFFIVVIGIFSVAVNVKQVLSSSSISSGSSLVKFARIFRVLRVLRIFKLVRFWQVTKARVMNKELSLDIAEHVQKITVLVCFVKAHVLSQKLALKFFGEESLQDAVELAHSILQSQVACFKAILLAVQEQQQLDNVMLQEIHELRLRKKVAENLQHFVVHAHESGILSGKEAEALYKPLKEQIKLANTKLKQTHQGFVSKRTPTEGDFSRSDVSGVANENGTQLGS